MIQPLLVQAGRHGPLVLVAGLVAGLAFPQAASVFFPLLPALVVLLLVLSALRISPRELVGGTRSLPAAAMVALGMQLALPLLVIGIAMVFGLSSNLYVLALILMCAAPPTAGSANIVAIMGYSPAPALRFLVAGCALLPLTVLPILSVTPALGEAGGVTSAALTLLVTILGSTALALALRRTVLRAPSEDTLKAIDGAAAITLAVFVVALMPALRETAGTAPFAAALWLGWALLINLGLQILTFFSVRDHLPKDAAVGMALQSGNRNVALFLVSLPPEVTAPLLVFIACYQVPMYLTPILMRRVFV